MDLFEVTTADLYIWFKQKNVDMFRAYINRVDDWDAARICRLYLSKDEAFDNLIIELFRTRRAAISSVVVINNRVYTSSRPIDDYDDSQEMCAIYQSPGYFRKNFEKRRTYYSRRKPFTSRKHREAITDILLEDPEILKKLVIDGNYDEWLKEIYYKLPCHIILKNYVTNSRLILCPHTISHISTDDIISLINNGYFDSQKIVFITMELIIRNDLDNIDPARLPYPAKRVLNAYRPDLMPEMIYDLKDVEYLEEVDEIREYPRSMIEDAISSPRIRKLHDNLNIVYPGVVTLSKLLSKKGKFYHLLKESHRRLISTEEVITLVDGTNVNTNPIYRRDDDMFSNPMTAQYLRWHLRDLAPMYHAIVTSVVTMRHIFGNRKKWWTDQPSDVIITCE